MIRYATDKKMPVKIIMFDSNRNLNKLLFKKEFDNMANINKNLMVIYTITDDEDQEHNEQQSQSNANDWKGEYGRIYKAMILK
jgi:NAD(P)H-flavin reductase